MLWISQCRSEEMKTRKRITTVAALFLTWPCAARAIQQAKASDPPSATKTVSSNARAGAVVSVPADYRIGVSDVIAVNVWKDADLSGTVPVRPDGKISLPLIGDIEAAGKTTGELHDLVVARLKPYVPDPDVTVIVEEINSQKYFVIGQVVHPGAFVLTAPTTVVEALAAAGGFVDWAKTTKIMIVRHATGNQTERIPFNYKNWLKKSSKGGSSIQLKNGDVIVVP
jgi:polysaccharide biosynthesis/export protein